MRRLAFIFLLFLWCGGLRLAAAAGPAPSEQPMLRPLQRRPYAVALRALDNGALLEGFEPHRSMQTASVLKLLTVGAALHILGADHRFHTEIFQAGSTLYLKGYGDPYLVSEEWQLLVEALPRELNFDTVMVDDSFFAPALGIVQEPKVYSPYNARNGAFATNFNTLAFRLDAHGAVQPEPQTPWVEWIRLERLAGRSLKPKIAIRSTSEHLWVSVTARPNTVHDLRIHLGFAAESAALYAGHLFVAMGQRLGRPWRVKEISRAVVPPTAPLVARYANSRSLAEVCRGLFKFSNNFVANQLVLALGAQVLHPPATLDKGLQVLRRYAEENGLAPITFFEASGLDPRDTSSAAAITQYLHRQLEQQPQQHWLDLLEPLLGGRVRAKSGTFQDSGVRNLAGYVLCAGRPVYAFAFFCQASAKACGPHTPLLYQRVLADIVTRLDKEHPRQCLEP